jgi:hypothetical protein
MASVAPLRQAMFPRIVPTTSEFLQTVPFSGQKPVDVDVGGDDTKRTPAGKPIVSARALLLSRRLHQDRHVGGRDTASLNMPRPLPRRLTPTAKVRVGSSKAKTQADRRTEAPERFRGR